MPIQKVQRLRLGFGERYPLLSHPVDETGSRMVFGIPRIHASECRLGLRNGQHRPFCDHVEFAVGDDGRDFKDDVDLGVEAGHLHIHPDKVRRHASLLDGVTAFGRIYHSPRFQAPFSCVSP